MPPLRLICAPSIGIALGLFSRGSDLLPRELGWLGNLGAIWLACAFAAGALVGVSSIRAGIAGATALAIATLVHYWSVRVVLHGSGADLLGFSVPQWLLVGMVLGALFGALGRAWRDLQWKVPAAIGLSAVFGAEALFLSVAAEPNASRLAVPWALACFVTVPFALTPSARERATAMAGAVLLTPPIAVAIGTAVMLGRRVY